ncbi:FUSC family membrane protein [Thiomonas delicata]|uniref:Putative Permease of the major facilitator superfamily n=1 Tax=Thiomonas delicata TaxID=364030 RepID=A0A238D6B6_THIDL|nr:FUSC family membrane protein [Thiomonas delicata]SBP88704.1 putative Permease of the major facilitator superfamily [Thiomonas delicata]
MNPMASLSRVVLGHYFTSGLVSAVGVLVLGVLGNALGGMALAVPLASGALTICFADNPAPIKVKAVELLFATFASGLCFALVWASVGHPWVEFLLVPALGFGAGLVSLWGKRALAISFSLLFITIITLGSPAAPNLRAYASSVGVFVLGGLIFTGYALVLSHLLRSRTKQQALAELLVALAAYMRWQSQFYGQRQADDAYGRAAILQGAVNDALQSARDLVLRESRLAHDAVWTRMLLEALDLFEAQLAAQTDSTLLRSQFEGTEVLDALQDGTARTADALQDLALALLRRRPVGAPPPDPARWAALERQADSLVRAAPAELSQARSALTSLLHTLREIDKLLANLQNSFATRDADAKLPELPDLAQFVSPWRYDPHQVPAHLRLGSPIFRHAVRLALALACGFVVSRALFTHQTHDYWVLLTIAVILRPNYGVTRQRLKDRLLGTLLGCLLTAGLLSLHLGLAAELATMFLALAVARAFVTTNYRFTAMAASVLALLLARLLEGDPRFLVDQRLIDTALGAALAWGFSYVLPRWEYQDVPRQLSALMRAQHDYARAVLATELQDEGAFRLARKRQFDALAAITGVYSRMLEEPPSRRRALNELAQLITHSYLLAAHLASMRVQRALRAKRLSPQSIEAMIAPTRDWVLRRLGRQSPTTRGSALAVDPAPPPAESDTAGSPPDPLLRRLALLRHEAAQIAAIGPRVERELHTPARAGATA